MTYARPRDTLLYRAFLASLALHLVLIALIPPLVASDSSQTIETLAFVHTVRLDVIEPTAHPLPRPRSRARIYAPKPRVARHHVERAAPRLRRLPHAHASPTQVVERAPQVASAVSAGAAHSTKAQGPVSVAAAPIVAAVPQPPIRQAIGGTMPLGAEEPTPVLDPAVLKALDALGVHVTLTVTVGGNGRTLAVAFAPQLTAAIEAQIRALLASASWDPAVCGAGMTCQAQATIRL